MIDPQNIVREYTDSELEELLIFTICVAGKSAKTIAPRANKLFKYLQKITQSDTPFKSDGWPLDLDETMRRLGIGCYTSKADTMYEIWLSRFDLRTCTVEDLMSIKGIGPKTAKAFIMWSRPNEKHAILDTHILKWLKEQGVENVPKSTPGSKKQYQRLEQEFLNRVPVGKTAAEFDLEIWKGYASKEAASQANIGVTSVY